MLEVHNQGLSLAWPAVHALHEILKDRGLDGALNTNIPDLPRVFSTISRQVYQEQFNHALIHKKSLSSYRYFKLHTFREKYVNDMCNFQGVRLKFKARAGVLELESLHEKYGLSNGICKLCHGERETLSHFMFICPALNHIRIDVFHALESNLLGTQYEHVWHSFCASSSVSKLNLLLGEQGYLFNENVGSLFDSLCKIYLISGWAERRRLLELTI
jgi:hypothetical protein